MLFSSPILLILIGLDSESYARIWPLEWHTAPLFAWFCAVNRLCGVLHLSCFGSLVFTFGIPSVESPVRAGKSRSWETLSLLWRHEFLLPIPIVRFWGLMIRNRGRRMWSVSVKREWSAISGQFEKRVPDGSGGQKGKSKGRRLGASAFVPPTHPKEGRMGHPGLWLGEKKQRVRHPPEAERTNPPLAAKVL